MRKYFLTTTILCACCCVFSQSSREKIALKQIDSLKKVLSATRNKSKVDCLNELSAKFASVYNDELGRSFDSAYKYAMQAYKEAGKISYQRGLGYSNLYLGIAYDRKHEIYLNANNWTQSDTVLLKIEEKFINQAISIGERLKENGILGPAYCTMSGIILGSDNWYFKNQETIVRAINCLKKGISYLEEEKKEASPLRKSELVYSLANNYWYLCNIETQAKDLASAKTHAEKAISYFQDAGENETVGRLYIQLISINNRMNDQKTKEENLKKAVIYFEKTGPNKSSGHIYSQLGQMYFGQKDFKKWENNLIKAINSYRQAGDEEGENSSCISITWLYISTGNFEKGFPYCERSLQLTEKLSSVSNKKLAIWGTPYFYMSRLYRYAGDYETALLYLYQCKKWYNESGLPGNATAEIGDIHRLMKNYDSSMYYLKSFDTVKRSVSTTYGILNLGNLLIDLKEYDRAISLIKESISVAEGGANYTSLAKAYLGKKNYQEALIAARKANTILETEVHKIRMMDNYELLSQIFYNLKKEDSAYYYLKQYTGLKDSLLTRQFYWRINNYKRAAEEDKKTSQIKLLNKDNQLKQQQLEQQALIKEQKEARLALLDKDNKIKEQQLHQETYLRKQKEADLGLLNKENQLKEEKLRQQAFVKNSLIAGIVLLFLLGSLILLNLSLKRRNDKLRLQKSLELQQLESEKKHAELQQQAAELEMQALRAQMNPHFIFNCLSSINRFVIKNETETASDYLTRFSRLIRMVLINSQKSLITLEDELETLRLYLDLERLRFKNSFDYNIIFTNTIDAGGIFVPPLLLQPFCENSIWHGLMHKNEQGVLDIAIAIHNNVLNCTITDNGIGRKKAAEMKSKSAEKEKSMGLKITTERLALLNKDSSTRTSYEIEDLYGADGTSAGTKVKLQIKYKEPLKKVLGEIL